MVLVGFSALVLVVPVDRTDDGDECGGAPAVAVAVGVDTAAPGDGDACRSEARSLVLWFGLLFLLPGALLLWRQWWRWRGVEEVVDVPPPPGSPNGVEPSRAGPPDDAVPGEGVSPGLVPGQPVDLYLGQRKALFLLLVAPCMFFLGPIAWVAFRAGRLGRQHRPVLSLDDTGLTDHRFAVVVPWTLVHGVELVGDQLAIDVGEEFRPRPGWRPGSVMRWLALRLGMTRRRIQLDVSGIEGVEAFVSEAASRVRPRPGQLPDCLVLYQWSWWLAGIPAGAALAVLTLRLYESEGLSAGSLVLVAGALWLLWRGLRAVRGRPLLVLDRDGITASRRPAFHATWDQVSSVEFRRAGQQGTNQLLVRLHASPADQSVNVDGLSVPAQEIAEVAERMHARHPDGTITDSSQTIGSRPNRLLAAGAVAVAVVVVTVGLSIRRTAEMASGDCYRRSGNQALQSPCDQPHDGEILLVLEHPADDGTKHPGNGALDNWAAPQCDAAFASYVGRPESADDELTYEMWRPELDAWAEGDRTIICVVVNETGALLEDRVKA